MNRVLKRLTLSVFALLLISCDGNRLMDENIELGKSGWSSADAKSFNFNVADTVSRYNVLVNVRNTSEYKYKNLYLFIEMTSPSNKFFRDTVEFQLADAKGKWLGSGIGNIWQNQLLLIREAKLLELGNYSVKIIHGMRDDTLNEISDVGLRVEMANE